MTGKTHAQRVDLTTTAAQRDKQNPSKWCPRCQEHELAPPPQHALSNQKHEDYCRNRILGRMNQRQSYAKASGCSATTTASQASTKLERRVEIINRMRWLSTQTLEQDKRGKDLIESKVNEIAENCMGKIPVRDQFGKIIGEKIVDAKNAIAAYTLLGKDLGMWKEQVEITHPDGELHGKTDEETMAMIESSLTELGRPLFMQMAEKLFGLKLEDGGKTAGGSEDTPPVPVPTVH